MEERDLLKEMFECYFRFRKMNSELPPDRLLDAIIGALSGADYPKIVREDLLRNLIADCDTIKETTKRVKTLREQALNVVTAPIAIIQDKKLTSSDWLEIDEVCKEFKLPKNNIKSKKWR